MPRGFYARFTSLILTGACTLTPISAAESRWAGYLVDRSCAKNCQEQRLGTDFLKEHKKECALNQTCSKDGYAVFAKGQWFYLDKKGNELARDILSKSPTQEGHFVIVSGSANPPAKSQMTGEITVSKIRELAQQ